MKLWDTIDELGQAVAGWARENYANLAVMAILIFVGMIVGYGITWVEFEAALEEIKILAQGG